MELSDGVQRVDDPGRGRAGRPSSLPAGRDDSAGQRSELGNAVLQSRAEFRRGDDTAWGAPASRHWAARTGPKSATELHFWTQTGSPDLEVTIFAWHPKEQRLWWAEWYQEEERRTPGAHTAMFPVLSPLETSWAPRRAADHRDRARAARRGPRHGLDVDRRRVGPGGRAAALHVSPSGDSSHRRNRRVAYGSVSRRHSTRRREGGRLDAPAQPEDGEPDRAATAPGRAGFCSSRQRTCGAPTPPTAATR